MYRHTQEGWVIRIAIGGAGLVMAVISLIGAMSHPGEAGAYAVLLATAALMFLIAELFGSMTVTVDDSVVEASFGPGAIRYRFDLENVTACRPVRNTAIMGWGIHYYGRGWLYNVSGWEAVELDLAGGRQLRIGTDEPDALCDAISSRLR